MAQLTEEMDFLDGEFLTFSINAALQHSSTYATDDEKDKEKVRRELRRGLSVLGEKYKSGFGDEGHIENIQELSRLVEKDYAEFLNGDHLRFGVAQKALNLYLKYLWCAGVRPKPPHCPFDKNIIGKLTLPKGCERRWTQGNVQHYREWVKAAKKAAESEAAENEAEDKEKGRKEVSLSDWELREWNKAQALQRGL